VGSSSRECRHSLLLPSEKRQILSSPGKKSFTRPFPASPSFLPLPISINPRQDADCRGREQAQQQHLLSSLQQTCCSVQQQSRTARRGRRCRGVGSVQAAKSSGKHHLVPFLPYSSMLSSCQTNLARFHSPQVTNKISILNCIRT